jgi:hypothetical protein
VLKPAHKRLSDAVRNYDKFLGVELKSGLDAPFHRMEDMAATQAEIEDAEADLLRLRLGSSSKSRSRLPCRSMILMCRPPDLTGVTPLRRMTSLGVGRVLGRECADVDPSLVLVELSVEINGGVYQRQVREGLWEVAQLLSS